MAKSYQIAVLPGDGIGPEVMGVALEVLGKIGARHGLSFQFTEFKFGGAAIDAYGVPVRDQDMNEIARRDCVLLAAVGGPKWEPLDYSIRPERALLRIRAELGLFANLRPATVFPELVDASTLKREVIEGIDILVLRELVGGIYFGKPKGIERTPEGYRRGINTMTYTEPEIERIARLGFELAGRRRKKLTSVDKANVLETTELWREVVTQVGKDYPGVALSHMYVDNAAMQLVRNPRQFDVLLTENLFGDILSDEAAMLTGSIGLLPSASLGVAKGGGEGPRMGLFEPVHGSAPDIAGRDMANPIATVLSVAMMLKYSLAAPEAGAAIERAVSSVLAKGLRTADIAEKNKKVIGTKEMGRAILEAL